MRLAVRAAAVQGFLWSSSAFVRTNAPPAATVAATMATSSTASASPAAATAADDALYTLYASSACPYAQRSLITAKELGLPFQLHPIQLGKDNKEAWYQDINPLGKVPAVVAGDDVVVESLVINEYLVDRFGGEKGAGQLMPESALGRALVRIAVQRCSQFLDAYNGYLRCKNLEELGAKKEAFMTELAALDASLAKSTSGWLVGDTISLADIAYFPFFERALPCLTALRGFDWGAAGVPRVLAWVERCKGRPSIAETLRGDPQEWVDIYQKYLGIEPTK